MTRPDPLQAHLRHCEVRGLRPNTRRGRREQLSRLARHFGLLPGEDLLLLTADDLEQWQHSMQHHSANYRSTSVVHVREFYRFCLQRDYLDSDPSQRLVLPKMPDRVPRPISDVDLDTAIALAPDRVRPMLVLAAYCGLRACEIAQLTREQVRDETAQPSLVVIGKGDKQRVIPLPQRVLAELRRYGLPQQGPVFPNRDDRPGAITPNRVSYLCNRYLHSLGIADTLHALRHFYGTSLYAQSKDIVMVQRVMGHASVATTGGYVAYNALAAQASTDAVAGPADYQPQVRLRAVADLPTPPTLRPAELGGVRGLGELSRRELEVLTHLAQGRSGRRIAELLDLSEGTVKSHLQRISRKLGTRGRASSVAVALRAGLVARPRPGDALCAPLSRGVLTDTPMASVPPRRVPPCDAASTLPPSPLGALMSRLVWTTAMIRADDLKGGDVALLPIPGYDDMWLHVAGAQATETDRLPIVPIVRLSALPRYVDVDDGVAPGPTVTLAPYDLVEVQCTLDDRRVTAANTDPMGVATLEQTS